MKIRTEKTRSKHTEERNEYRKYFHKAYTNYNIQMEQLITHDPRIFFQKRQCYEGISTKFTK